MGSEPNRLIKTLRSNPDSLTWSISREVQVLRGPTGKLGLRFQTVQCFAKGVCNTLVLAVRDTCIVRGGELHNLDRVHMINGNSLAHKTEDEVDAILQDKSESVFNLQVQSEVSLKRDNLSDCVAENSSQGRQASSGSNCSAIMDGVGGNKPKRMLSNTGSSGKTSMCSVERPSAGAPNKRFMKSNSTEKEEGQQTDLTSASMNPPHPLAPSVDGYVSNIEGCSYQRINSMPDPLSSAEIGIEIDEGERQHSLPTMNGTGRTVGTFHGCDNGVGTVKTLKPGQLNIRRCSNRNCLVEKDGCLWHSLIFKVPQFVVWDWSSITVTLNKGNSSTFGIDKKVKIHEATGDMYTLVKSVAPGTVAEEYDLHVGDWIRSINGHALQSREEAHHTKFDHFTEIRLVIQRPEGILQKAQTQAQKINKEMKTPMTPLKMPQGRCPPAVYSPSSPAIPRNLILYPNIPPQGGPVSPYPVRQVSPLVGSPRLRSPCQDGVYSHGCVNNGSPSSLYPVRQVSPLLGSHDVSPGLPSSGQDVIYSRGYGSNRSPRTPEIRCGTCGKETSPQIPLPSSPQSPDDNCSPLYEMGGGSPRSPRDGHVPCVRVFLCGNSAPELASMILSRSQLHHSIPYDSHVHMLRFCLKQYENTDILVDLWQKRKTVSRDHFRVINGNGYFNTSTSSMCTECGGDANVVNVELFVIQDENFFHHCSHYLFTKESVFLIAFNAQRILTNMSTDISRLEELIHTIQSHVGNSAQIDVYGVLNSEAGEPGEENKDDEVRTMFYANDNQHGKYSVSIPLINFVTRLNMHEATSSICARLFRQTLSRDQKKSSAVEHVECISEVLSGLVHESRSVWSIDEIRQRIAMVSPQYKDHIMQASVLLLLDQMGSIRCVTEKCSPFQEPGSGQDYFVHPVTVQKRLECLCIASKDSIDGEVMLNLSVTGVMLRSELSSLLHNIVPDMDMFIQCLQTLGVVYDVGPAGNSHDRAIFIPYFLEDMTCNPPKMTSDLCLLVEFHKAVPWTVFFRLVSALGQRPECQRVKFSTLRFCVVTLRDITLNLMFEKMKDKFIITVARSAHSVKENVVLQLFQQILASIVPYSHYTLGPVCPLGEDHPHVTGHVVNLTSSPIMCGNVCLENDSKVKRWIEVDRKQNVEDYLSRNILKLPPGVFQDITDKLLIIPSNDWKTLAGRLNKTSGQVEVYESKARYKGEVPSKLLLIDWAHMEGGTIRQLLEHLTAMERHDVRAIITEYLNIPVDG